MSRPAAAASTASSQPKLPPPRPVELTPASEIPHYQIDLDQPPQVRWKEIIKQYRPYWSMMVEEMWKEFEDIHGEYIPHEEEEPDGPTSSSKKTKAKKQKKLTPTERAAAAERRHQQHVAFATNLAKQLMHAFRVQGLADYAEEMEVVSAESGIQLHELVLLNLSYEAHGGCTTILAPLADGSILMGRTLDWQQPALKHLTVELSFMRGGKLLYRATSFAGFLGIFTGHKPNAYSIAVNFRCTDDEVEQQDEEEEEKEQEDANDEEMQTAEDDQDLNEPEFSWPVGFLVRHTFESCSTYSTALSRLHQCALMSQVYFIICGTKANQGCIITRNPQGSVQPVHLHHPTTKSDASDTTMDGSSILVNDVTHHKAQPSNKSSSTSAASTSSTSSTRFNLNAIAAADPSTIPISTPSLVPWIVQANMDHWLTLRRLDHQESLPRTKLVHQMMKQLQASTSTTGSQTSPAATMTEQSMWQLLSLDPIWDDETIYATISIPAQDRFVTLLQNPFPPKPTTKKGTKGGTRRKRR